ncbi:MULTISPECIES: DUF4258 domain-containing protein [unclassified Variovorax]|uniref:DUF4258 domain-containing protein n=1 Tax=unclassified Variovorax TaxID=663243 RepID=UPI00210DC747|nr:MULTISPECIES: DUF4258 domain-containing protein [unclassified Variovorax]
MNHASTPTNPSAVAVPLPTLTKHASTRMQQRGIGLDDIDAALTYGRTIHAKGVTFFVIGRKEVQKFSAQGIDLAAAAGIQVLVSHDGAVVTTYRSHDLHAIKSPPRAQRHCHSISHH